jgi:ribosomal protein L27
MFSFTTFQFHAGKNVGLGKDHTIFSLIDGLVKFEKFGPDRKKVTFYVTKPYNSCFKELHFPE